MRYHDVLRTTLGIAVGLILAAGASLTWIAHAQDRVLVATGARVYSQQGCYGCHQIGAAGTPIGPDLSRVGAKYAEPDLVRWLSDPASQKPNAHMPKLELTSAEVTALAAFLATLQ
jgi:mono/diheme cytochrome c family protein